MIKLLNNDNITEQGKTSAWKRIVKNIKEDVCFLSLDLTTDQEKAAKSSELNKNYILPDGQLVTVNSPRFLAPEALFNPRLIKDSDENLGMH